MTAAGVLILLGAAAPAGEQDRLRWLGEMRHIAVYVPPTAPSGSALLLVMSDPRRGARYALGSWRELAEREGVVLAAVSSEQPGVWRVPQDGPGFLRAVVQRVSTRRAIDPRRVYLFGTGVGGRFALSMGLLQPHYFAAVASYDLLRAAVDAALAQGKTVRVGNVFTSDLFYHPDEGRVDIMENMGVLAIEMEAVVPLVRDLQRVLGEPTVLDALDERVRLQNEAARRAPPREPDFDAIERSMAGFAAGGALDFETVDKGDDHVDMDVTRCGYAALMERLGARDLGSALLCAQDLAVAERIGAKLERSQTYMEGASHCDFRFRRRRPPEA